MVPESTESLQDVGDDVLVARCKKELPYQVEAYKELLRRHEPLVYNTCVKMIGSVQDAQEVCQDAFLQVFHKLHQFEGRSAFKTWLFRIVYNLCLNRRASLARKSDRESKISEEIVTQLATQETEAGIEDLSDNVQEALGTLEEEKRRIVVLKYVSGLSLQEIADVLEIKLSATKMRLYRALEEFKVAYLEVQSRQQHEPSTPAQTQ